MAIFHVCVVKKSDFVIDRIRISPARRVQCAPRSDYQWPMQSDAAAAADLRNRCCERAMIAAAAESESGGGEVR